MAVEVLSPTPKLKFFDNNGKPANGYRLFTYAALSSTKIATYTDSSGSTQNSNPLTLDFRGEPAVGLWIPPNVAYKYVFAPPGVDDPPTNPIWTVDNLVSSQLITLFGGVDTGSANSYVLNFVSNFTSYTDGIIIYWIPANTNTGLSTLNVNGLGAITIVDSQGASLAPGAIVANQITTVMYLSGKWVLLNSVTNLGFFTGTLTGMTTVVTGSILYKIFGGLCTLTGGGLNTVGTSNTTAMTMTGLPTSVRPGVQRTVPCAALRDNGNTVLGVASVAVAGTITFNVSTVSGTQIVPGAFTNSGSKGVLGDWSITYPLGS